MKTAYKWFDYFLNLLLVSTFLGLVLFFFRLYQNQNFNEIDANRPQEIFTVLLLTSFGFGILYILLGIILLIINKLKKKNENSGKAKGILVKGFVRGILSFILFFVFSLVTSFFGLSLSSSNDLPRISDPNTPGFPVSDLTVIKKKNVPPQISDDSWSCEVTIKNNNTTKTAVELTFANGEDDNENFNDDAIAPGKTRAITVYNNDAHTLQNPCKNISISAAEIMNKGSDN